MNILTMPGGFSVMSDDEVKQCPGFIFKCGMCSDDSADVYHQAEHKMLHASGHYLVSLMPKLHKVKVN